MTDQSALLGASLDAPYRLVDSIPAIQACYGVDGNAELGAITHLPLGAEVTFCGDGFNERTLKIRWEGQFFFVFRNDLALNAGASPIDSLPRKSSGAETAPAVLSAANVA